MTFSAAVPAALETELLATPSWPWPWGLARGHRGRLLRRYTLMGVQEHWPGATPPGSRSLISKSGTWPPRASATHLGPSRSQPRLTLGSADLLGDVRGLGVRPPPVLSCVEARGSGKRGSGKTQRFLKHLLCASHRAEHVHARQPVTSSWQPRKGTLPVLHPRRDGGPERAPASSGGGAGRQ